MNGGNDMQSFLTALIECSVSMSALILGLIILTPLLSKRYTAKWVYYAWLIVAIGLIIPFRLHPDIPVIHMDTAFYIQNLMPGYVGNITEQAIEADAARQGFSSIPWRQITGMIWVMGVAAFVFYHGWKHYLFKKMVNRWGENATNPSVFETLRKIMSNMGITRQISLKICPLISSPMLIGVFSPVILLPRADFSESELSLILRHELIHFKRMDLWYKSLVFFVTAIHWFNPAVYLMAKEISAQCEISCDAEVVKGAEMDVRQRYSETIINVIKNQFKIKTVFSTNFYGGKKGMKKRIFSIMDTTKKKAGIVVLALVIVCTLGTGAAFAAGNEQTNNQGSYSTNMVLSDQEKEQFDLQSKKELAKKYAMYEEFGLVYDQASDSFYYNDQPVRYFSDKLDAMGIYNSFTRSNGTVDLVTVRNSDNELIGITPVTQEEFDRHTASIKRAQDANVQGSSQENADNNAVNGLTSGSVSIENGNIVSGSSSAFSEGDPDYADNSLNAYIDYGISYDKANKQWIFSNKPVHFLSDGDNVTFVDNSDNALKNGISLKVVRKADGDIDKLVEISGEEAQALFNK
jgi:bla regulator protein BlaR1